MDRSEEILAQLRAMDTRLESAISFLSDRVGKVETKIDALAVKTDRVETIACELARKLLAPVELRALGVQAASGGGGSEAPIALAARSGG
jgi:hypothetical protein